MLGIDTGKLVKQATDALAPYLAEVQEMSQELNVNLQDIEAAIVAEAKGQATTNQLLKLCLFELRKANKKGA